MTKKGSFVKAAQNPASMLDFGLGYSGVLAAARFTGACTGTPAGACTRAVSGTE
jgi:hypothetical protein